MKQWYLIQAKPKQEARAKEHLDNQDVECFYPTIELEKVVRGKRQKVTEALFANYLFVQLDSEDIAWSKIRSTRGVRDFVRFGLEVAKVPNALIEQLKADVKNIDVENLDTNVPKEGEAILLIEGPFKDLEAIFKAKNGDERAIILLNLLNKPVTMEVSNRSFVKK